ncbi:MAG: hypothetical protein LBC83_07890 [Oscillospiraceae bacterium]|jgi:hypothetical protein|nr:hypothetical protein [Oscillospiraceae bacterium]
MKSHRKIFALLLTVLLCAGLATPGFAADDGRIYLNGAAFSGTLREALAQACGGGLVEIEGRVTTLPVGLRDGSFDGGLIFHDLTLRGKGENAQIVLQAGYNDSLNAELRDRREDVLTVRGDGVTIENLTINARFGVDFALRVFADRFSATDVICLGGQRGAVNILSRYTGKTMLLRRVQANYSRQGGFYFDESPDCGGLVLEDCSTEGNIRAGVLVRNGYDAVGNLDLSGVRCKEGVFAVEDRAAGRIGDGAPAPITLLAPPRNAAGVPIDTAKALFFALEGAYKHIRYGAEVGQYAGAAHSIQTQRYGFTTRIFYTLQSSAAADLREGEAIAANTADWLAMSFGKVFAVCNWLLDCAVKGVAAYAKAVF